MRWWHEISFVFARLIRRRQAAEDLEEEMKAHIELEIDEMIADGMSPQEARYAAQRAFGSIALSKERSREMWGLRSMEILYQDIRFGLRMLVKNPVFTLVAILTLALGIGANSAIFSVINAVLLRPLPYNDAERLVYGSMSLPDYQDLKERNQVFDESAVYASNLYNLKLAEGSEQILAGQVSPSFFTLLGKPLLGCTFKEQEGHERVAVISYRFWQRLYAGDRSAVGKTLNLSGNIFTIIGVMPPQFQFPNAQFEVWLPLDSAMAKTPGQGQNRNLRIFRVVAHLKPGVTPEQMRANLDEISNELEKQYPQSNTGVRLRFISLTEFMVGNVRTALYVLIGAVGLLLLIACANVANLLLARTTTREREIAIRTALGAGKWRILRQFLTESVLLSVLGGCLGLVLAMWGINLLPKLGATMLPRADSIDIDLTVLLFTIGMSLLTGIIFGTVPVLQISKFNINQSLKEGGKDGLWGGRGRKLRSTIVVAEVALAIIVLIGAGLLIKSFVRILSVDPGFVTDNLLTFNVQLVKYKEAHQRAAAAMQVVEKVAQLPGVQLAGGGTGMPPNLAQRATRFEIEGIPLDLQSNAAFFIATTPDYFSALGTPLIHGRFFNDGDRAESQKVVIINKRMAQRLFPNENPLGRQMKLINPEQSPEARTIVGVVGDIKYSGMDSESQPTIYTPFTQTPFLWTYVMVRTNSQSEHLTASIHKTLAAIDGDLTAAKIQPMEQVIADTVAQPRFSALLLAIFAGLSLVLAAVGIYGVISYNVAQRTREIGVRMALGARPGDVLKMVLKQGLLLGLLGILIGIPAAIALTRYMASILFEVSATDPATFALIAFVLLAVNMLASLIPARRATRIDPMIALRYE